MHMSATGISAYAGFSLIEIVITIALFGMVTMVVLSGGIPWYQRAVVHTNKIALAAALSRARAQALFAYDGLPHGVYVSGNEYALFSGERFDPENPAAVRGYFDPGVSVAVPQEVVFAQHTARHDEPTTIKLQVEFGGAVEVVINREGLITW